MNTQSTTKKIVFTAMFAALTCVATMVIKIPSPLNGYLNLGDCIVLLAGWMLSPTYGFLAAAIGSGLADLFGYPMYAPATFVIKGCMALVAYFVYKALNKKLGDLPSRIISGIAAEAVMILGYLAFETILYGFMPSLANAVPNCIQGAAGLILGVILVKIFVRRKITDDATEQGNEVQSDSTEQKQ